MYDEVYTSQYPTQDADHVKATTTYDHVGYEPYFATDPALSVIDAAAANAWLSLLTHTTNQRFHIDLGSGKVIKRIYYENLHSSGAWQISGVKNFTFWGSNTEASFLELTYATDTGWTQLTTAQSTFDQHSAPNEADPKYILVTNSTAYRYYAFKFADSYGGTVPNCMGFRRIELQTLTYIHKLLGTSANVISTTGAINIISHLLGTSINTINTTAELTLGIVEKISGTSTSALSTIGAINLTLDLTGTSVNAISTIATLNVVLDLTGISVNVISTIGVINATFILGGTSSNTISTTGEIGIILTLAGTSENIFTAISTVELFVPIWTKVDEITTTWLEGDKGALDWTESVKSKSK